MFLGMLLISAGMMGHMLRDLNWPLRILAIVGGLGLIDPGWQTDVFGLAVLIILLAVQLAAKKSSAQPA